MDYEPISHHIGFVPFSLFSSPLCLYHSPLSFWRSRFYERVLCMRGGFVAAGCVLECRLLQVVHSLSPLPSTTSSRRGPFDFSLLLRLRLWEKNQFPFLLSRFIGKMPKKLVTEDETHSTADFNFLIQI